MEREFQGEWDRLEREARATLMRLPDRERGLPECHAVLLPSFEDCRSYTIFVRATDASEAPIGVRRVWRRLVDGAKFEGPVIRLRHGPKLQPTIEERETVLSPDVVAGILARAAAIRVPARIAERAMGADGESYVLSFGGLFVSTRFAWWCDPPPGWEPLAGLLNDVVRAIDGGPP